MLIDQLIDELGAITISKPAFKGELYKAKNLLLLKPHTFMNLSGESVVSVANYYKIDNDAIAVAHDELDIPLGSIRLKIGGGSGGHNGIKSIDSHIGNDYIRLRLGIGRPEHKSAVTGYVLGDFAKEQTPCLEKILETATKIAQDLPHSDLPEIRQKYQLKQPICS